MAIPVDDIQWVCARMADTLSGTVTAYSELNYKLASATLSLQEIVRSLQLQKTDCMVYQALPPRPVQAYTENDAVTSYILWFKRVGMDSKSVYLKDGMTRILKKVDSIQDISAIADQLKRLSEHKYNEDGFIRFFH